MTTAVQERVLARVRAVVADVLGVSAEQLTPDSAAGQVEGWDSFGHLQVVLALEAEFGVQFDPIKIPELTTIAKLQAFIERTSKAG